MYLSSLLFHLFTNNDKMMINSEIITPHTNTKRLIAKDLQKSVSASFFIPSLLSHVRFTAHLLRIETLDIRDENGIKLSHIVVATGRL